jgi:hypothetical protein
VDSGQVLPDLPDAPEFVFRDPEISLADNIKLCEEMLPVWNKTRFEKHSEWPATTEEFYL